MRTGYDRGTDRPSWSRVPTFHDSLTRKTPKAALERRGLASRVLMPDDGIMHVGLIPFLLEPEILSAALG